MIKIAFVVCCAAYAAAEADADAGLLYGGYAAPIATGYGVTNVANTVGIAGAAPAAVPGLIGGYAGAGRYVANSAGTVHVAKREAEADAGLLYGGYGYGLGYAGLGYAGYGYPAYGYYGKRSADAEPEAKADAGLLYGGYGYGLGLGYAGYGYGIPAYGYSTLGYYGKRSADADAGYLYGGHGYGLGLGYGLGYRGYYYG